MRTYEITYTNRNVVTVEADSAVVNDGGCLVLLETTERGGKSMIMAYAAGTWAKVVLLNNG